VVDNASQDGSADMVEERFPGVSLIRNGSNLIFCKGQNLGIGNSSGDYVLVLNNDVVLEKDFVREAVRAMEVDARIGSVSGKILRKDGKKIEPLAFFPGTEGLCRGYGLPDKFMEPGCIFGAEGSASTGAPCSMI
jgi:GT2 family glycosyltransferase